jgi:hypothetical protein
MDRHDDRRGLQGAGNQVLENLSKSEAEKSAEMLDFQISILRGRKV